MNLLPSNSKAAATLLSKLRKGFARVVVLSIIMAMFPVAIGLLLLLELDVAIPGHSMATVIGLLAVAVFVLAFQTSIMGFRTKVLAQMGDLTARALRSALAGGTLLEVSAQEGNVVETVRLGELLDRLSGFWRSHNPQTCLDVLALPFVLLFLLSLSAWFAIPLALASIALGLVLVTALRRFGRLELEREDLNTARRIASMRIRTAPDIVRTLGMFAVVCAAWVRTHDRFSLAMTRALDDQQRLVVLGRLALVAVLLSQLTIGCLLVIGDNASIAVVVVACTISLMAMVPLVNVLATARELGSVWSASIMIDNILVHQTAAASRLLMPEPSVGLTCKSVAIAPPGGRIPLVQGVNLALGRGDILVILGGIGSGKSSLMKGLAGAWPLLAGEVRIDGVTHNQWDSHQLSRNIGYVSQSPDILDGTVAQNIARFDPAAEPDQIVAAARKVRAHEMILRLPDGYNTYIGYQGFGVSIGQAHLISMARAVYGQPFILLLDGATAHFGQRDTVQIVEMVRESSENGQIIIMAGVAAALVEIATHAIVLDSGRVIASGRKDEVQRQLSLGNATNIDRPTPVLEPQDNIGTQESSS